VALALGSVACVVLLAEGSLRFVGAGRFGLESWQTSFLHQPDSELIFSMRPNATSVWKTAEFVEEVTTNSLGLRGPEPSASRAAARIVVLGDSMTFGHGVGDEETYARRLAAHFAAAGRQVEVLNAGVRGYGSDQSFALYVTRLRSLRPDLVIFGHYRNDVDENVHQSLFRIEDGRLVGMDPTRNVLYRAGLLQQRIPDALLRLRLTRVAIAALLGWGRDEIGPEIHGGRPLAWSRSKILLEMEQLRRTLREDGGELLVLAVPSRDGPRDEYRWLAALVRLRIPVFDPGARLPWDEEGLFFRQDDHLTAAGHDRLARELHRHIVEAGLLPDPARS
jgi:hypothetical protein